MTDDKTTTAEWVRWTTISPDPDCWGDEQDPAYYHAVLAALERIVSEGWTERGAFSVQIAREAIANAKGGE